MAAPRLRLRRALPTEIVPRDEIMFGYWHNGWSKAAFMAREHALNQVRVYVAHTAPVSVMRLRRWMRSCACGRAGCGSRARDCTRR